MSQIFPGNLTLLTLALGVGIHASSGAIDLRRLNPWRALNSAVGGRLHTAQPIALPCFSLYNNLPVSLDEQACEVIQAGDIPPYYIEIETAADVQAAFNFSQTTGVALSIKNTGHDLIGRSRRRDSLGLWMSCDPTFVPEECKSLNRAITIGKAGVTFEQVYQFADQHNSTFVGGYAQTFGASGGWMADGTGGGHSILSPTLGLGVDRVLQMKIVTPDGELRTANTCQNTDLFWALRGGGGTFGVVIESTHLVEQRFPLQVINMTFEATSANLPEYFSILVNNSVRWAAEEWGGHINNVPPGIAYVNPQMSLKDAIASMAPLSAFATANNGTALVETFPSWFDFFARFVAIAEQAKILPVVAPISFNANTGATSVTPAWRDSLWHCVYGDRIKRFSTSQVTATLSAVHNFVRDDLGKLAPDSGAYMNEGNVYESNHEVSYWGPNYARLHEVKHKW
ncbi:hypothetical protein DFH06DRAFT_1274686 [Mycena polygramma]|nr:hypothetical protein DFH06DRAFT_1274686 [Mycena polygramma]